MFLAKSRRGFIEFECLKPLRLFAWNIAFNHRHLPTSSLWSSESFWNVYTLFLGFVFQLRYASKCHMIGLLKIAGYCTTAEVNVKYYFSETNFFLNFGFSESNYFFLIWMVLVPVKSNIFLKMLYCHNFFNCKCD